MPTQTHFCIICKQCQKQHRLLSLKKKHFFAFFPVTCKIVCNWMWFCVCLLKLSKRVCFVGFSGICFEILYPVFVCLLFCFYIMLPFSFFSCSLFFVTTNTTTAMSLLVFFGLLLLWLLLYNIVTTMQHISLI